VQQTLLTAWDHSAVGEFRYYNATTPVKCGALVKQVLEAFMQGYGGMWISDAYYISPTPSGADDAGRARFREQLSIQIHRLTGVMPRLQEEINANEFAEEGEAARVALEGFRNGLYVRVRLEGVPCEFTKHFRPTAPIVLGGVVAQESRLGLVRCRVKRHRWSKGVCKANDPLVVSCGWRRFQTVPMYCMEDAAEGGRNLGGVTSGGYGPSVGAPIAMGYVPNFAATPGTKLWAELRGKRLPVTVCELPFRPSTYKR
jgi:hypothetical protein